MKNTNEREIAAFAIMDIAEGGGYNNIVLSKTLSRYNNIEPSKKKMITEMVNGSLRNLIFIDYVISKFSKTALNKIKPFIKSLLRISVYQIIFMDKVPDSAACNEAVNIAKQKGFAGLTGYVNGVLRNISRNKNSIELPDKNKNWLDYVSVKYSHPKWLVEYWRDFLSEEQVVAVCEANNTAPQVSICVNKLKTNAENLEKMLISEGVSVERFDENAEDMLKIKGSSNIRDLESFKKGLYHIMDFSAMKAAKLSKVQPGQKLLDLCAAPGGKSFYGAYAMSNKGKILSLDIFDHKLELIEDGAKRLGISIIETGINNASKFNKAFEGAWDTVMLDAPCSGLGVLSKKPDARYNKSMEDVESLAEIQRGMLEVSSKYPVVGGRLLYSTCTISIKENEENINWFLQNFPYELEEKLTLLPSDGYGDGFFAACLIRKN